MTKLNAYLSFRDNAREALEFYQSIFDGQLDISTFAEYQASDDPSEGEKVMHGHLETDAGLEIMASDTPNSMDLNPGDNFALSLSGQASDAEELRGYWEKLSDGGQVAMPLEKAPWGDYFGMCVDKFGINWMVDFAAEESGEQAGQGAGDAEQAGDGEQAGDDEQAPNGEEQGGQASRSEQAEAEA